MTQKFAFIASAVALLAGSPAFAAAVIGDLSSSGFSYGSLTATGFVNYTAYPSGASNCLSLGACYNGSDKYAIIAASGNPGELLIHPGPGAGGNSAVQYTAPSSGLFSLSSILTSADIGQKNVGFFTIINNFLTANTVGSISGGASQAVDGTFALQAGDSVGIFVNNGDGNYSNDSTHASGTISAVPEPATWAMLLLGFGMIGFAMRKRSNVRTTVSYA